MMLFFLSSPDVNLKKCLGWHFELECHGSGLNESIEQYQLFAAGRAEAPRTLMPLRSSLCPWVPNATRLRLPEKSKE